MTDLGTLALGAYDATNSTIDGVGGTPSGDPLEVIASADDNDYIHTDNNNSTDEVAYVALANMPGDFDSMDSVSINVRYHRDVDTDTSKTWDSIVVEIFADNAGTTSLAGPATIVSGNITTTTATNSGATTVDATPTGTKAQWDAAYVRFTFNKTKSMAGNTDDFRITAAEVTGTYTQAAGGDATANPTVITAAVTMHAPTVTTGSIADPTVITASPTIHTPTIKTGSIADPVVITTNPTIPTPVALTTMIANPTAITAGITMYAPTVKTGAVKSPPVITVPITLPTPVVDDNTAPPPEPGPNTSPPFVVSSTTASQALGTSLACNIPAGAQNGDLLVAFFGVSDNAVSSTVTSPGWHNDDRTITSEGNDGSMDVLSHRIVDIDAEPASYTFSHSDSDPQAVVVVCVRGADIDTSSSWKHLHDIGSIGDDATPATTGVTTTVDDCLVLSFVFCFTNTELLTDGGEPAGQVLVGEEFVTGAGLVVSSALQAQDGATGTVTYTPSSPAATADWLEGTWAIAPGQVRRAPLTAANAWNPQWVLHDWHSMFWAEGSQMAEQAYSETDDVSPWPNETGESDATQATAGNKPHYVASDSAFNNKPTVDFTSASNHYLQSAAFTTNPTLPYSVVVIANWDVANGYFPAGIASGDNVIFLPSSFWRIHAGSTVVGSTSFATDATLLVGHVATGSNDWFTVDGADQGITSAGDNVMTGITLGTRYDATGNWFDGAAAFVGIYNGDITAAAWWDDFQDWVTSHYGISLVRT